MPCFVAQGLVYGCRRVGWVGYCYQQWGSGPPIVLGVDRLDIPNADHFTVVVNERFKNRMVEFLTGAEHS